MWFAVRHVIRNGSNYEERITIWNRASDSQAIEAAQTEASEYANALDDAEVPDFFQSYRLFDPPGDGTEVFSLIRSSELSSTEYIDAYLDCGDELQSDL